MWTYGTRNLTDDANNAVRDGVLSDATKFPGQRILDALVDIAPTRGSQLADGLEDILVENDYSALPKVARLEGSVDLTAMLAGDTIAIKLYKQIKVGGAYVLYHTDTYSGAQTEPLLKVITDWASIKIKVTLTQTAGVNRTYDFEFFTRKQA